MKEKYNHKSSKKTLKTKDDEIYKLYNKFISLTYPSFLKKFGINKIATKAIGAEITDSNGTNYIDCTGGYGLFNIGHNHPKIIRDIITQINKKQLFTKPFINEKQVEFARLLKEITPGNLTCSFLCNSGSEAIDNAIKLVRLNSKNKQIITAENSYHGYTYGALSATGIFSFKRSFQPLVPDIIQVPFGDFDILKKTINPETAAILLEPIQHEAGIAVPKKDYFKKVKQLCEKNNIILILDEIKTGMGKTGTMFACEDLGIVPDILVIGKSLGGGIYPVGALISTEQLWKKFSYNFSMSASSFSGNTLACTAAISTIKILQQENLATKSKKKGDFLIKELKKLIDKYPNVLKNISGKGLLLGLDTVNSQIALELTKRIIKNGVIVLPAYGNQSMIMIEPPLVITDDQLKKVISAINQACKGL